MNNKCPYVSFTRNPSDDGAEYFGPYFNSFAVKKALRYLRRVFPYYTRPPRAESKPDLDMHLGLSPANMNTVKYKANLRKLISYIKGDRKTIVAGLEREMKDASKKQDFEKAALLRNKINNLRELRRRIVFGDKEFLDISKDAALGDLVELLNLKKIPVRIEGYDVSHTSGSQVVASMVVFRNGASDRGQYRKFKTRFDRNDDFSNMKEIITRRFAQKNLDDWGTPDLVLIDGGKGQLDTAIKARKDCGHEDIAFIGLAKKEEQIVLKDLKPNSKKLTELNGFQTTSKDYILIDLPSSTHIIKLLQRIRDESHRFAVSYHTSLRRIRQTASLLDEIPGVGPKTRAKLIRRFGSIRGIKSAEESDIISVVGRKKAKLVADYIKGV